MITQRLTRFALGAVALVTAVGCTPQDEPQVEPAAAEAVVESIVASEVTPTSAKATINFKDAAQVFFAYYPTSEAANTPTWKTINVIASQTETVETLENLTPGIEYTLESYAVNADEKESASIKSTFKTIDGPTVSQVGEVTVGESTASVELSVANGDQLVYHFYVAGEVPTTPEWAEATIEDPVVLALEALTPGTDYELVVKYLNSVEGIESAELKIEFSTLNSIVAVVGERVKSFNVQIDIEFDSNRAQLWAYDFTDGQFGHVDNFKAAIANGNVKVSSAADTTITQSMVAPQWGYVFFTAPINVEADGSYTLVEDPAQYNYFTPALSTFGESTETVQIANLEEKLTINSAELQVTRGSENVHGFMSGFVAKSELGTGTLSEWLVANEWIVGKPADPFFYVGMDGTVTYEETKTKWLSSLAHGTEYVFFALAVDNQGDLSNPVSVEFSTNPVVFDETLSIVVDNVTPSFVSTNFDVHFTPEVAKFVHINSEAVLDPNNTWKYKTPEEAQASLINQGYNSYNGIKADNSNIVDGVFDLEISGLSENKEYILYYCAVGLDGSLGKMQSIEYSTKEFLLSSAATVTATYVSHTDGQWGGYNVTLDVTMANGATSFIVGVANANYLPDPANAQPADYAKYLLLENPWSNETYNADGEITHATALWDKADRIVIIPVDADGNYGVPVVYEFDKWPEEPVE